MSKIENKNELVQKFLINMEKVERKAEGTLIAYEKDLKYLLEHLKTNDVLTITKEQIESYISTCKANSSFDRRLSTYKKFFNWLVDTNIMDKNPAISIKSVKIPKRNPKYLRVNEVEQLINSIDGKHKFRDIAIIRTMLNGLRLEECANVKKNDIEKVNIITKEANGNYMLNVIGKEDKERRVPLFPETYNAIQEYLSVDYRRYSKNNMLFINQDGTQLSKSTIYKLTKKFLSKIERGNYSPHKLRHTCATYLLFVKRVNPKVLKEFLGHESLATTDIYLHLDDLTLITEING